MRIAILTIFPEMFQSPLSASILGRARAEGLLTVETVDIRPYSDRKHKNTDDYPFGGGAGMVMTAQPIVDAVEAARARGFEGPCLYMSPRGKPLTQAKVRELAAQDGLILLCGHYEGVDQRALDLAVDDEISLGDFVLTGGELAAMAVVDAVARLVPGVLGASESAQEESFSEDGLLEYPQYTRPREYRGMPVPEVLLGGDHAKIRAWRRRQALAVTLRRRPDLFRTAPMTPDERAETRRAVRLKRNAKAAEAGERSALAAPAARAIAGAAEGKALRPKPAKRGVAKARPLPATEDVPATGATAVENAPQKPDGQAQAVKSAKRGAAKARPLPATDEATATGMTAVENAPQKPDGQAQAKRPAKRGAAKARPSPATDDVPATGTTAVENAPQKPDGQAQAVKPAKRGAAKKSP
ncbi:MAG: tRNA (guanosine(37)-N1)-methyltransferase TrmD [Clostridiales bacterium]|nr:tRNA (guanosine(37)-N1)-methyltransferase TrmD [Clostridiales bacterium]